MNLERTISRFLIPFLFFSCSVKKMKHNKNMNNSSCDTTGVCSFQNPNIMDKKLKEEPKKNIEVIYAYDALCGWCYGFSYDLNKVVDSLGSKVKFTLINGGLFAGSRSVKMGQINAHIKRNMPSVTHITGVPFGTSFINGVLEESDYSYDSWKSSVAIMVIKEMLPEKTFELASNIQKAFFLEGKDIQSDHVYEHLISNYPINKEEFIKKLNSLEFAKKTEQEFKKASQYGFTGYPSCLLQKEDTTYVLSHGYLNADQLIQKIESEFHNIHLSLNQFFLRFYLLNPSSENKF